MMSPPYLSLLLCESSEILRKGAGAHNVLSKGVQTPHTL